MRCSKDRGMKGRIGYSFSVDFCRPGDSYREALLSLSALNSYENTAVASVLQICWAIAPQMKSTAGMF